jgi:hypothetical protein
MLLKMQANIKSTFALTFAKFLSANYNIATKQNTQCSSNATFWRVSGDVVGMAFATVLSVGIVAFPLTQLPICQIFRTSVNNINVQCLIFLPDFKRNFYFFDRFL